MSRVLRIQWQFLGAWVCEIRIVTMILYWITLLLSSGENFTLDNFTFEVLTRCNLKME